MTGNHRLVILWKCRKIYIGVISIQFYEFQVKKNRRNWWRTLKQPTAYENDKFYNFNEEQNENQKDVVTILSSYGIFK